MASVEADPPSQRKAVRPGAGHGDPGPLAGLRVVVTRALEQQGELAARLSALGATVISAPVIRIEPPSDNGSGLEAAVSRLADYDWIVFTSANGVEAFFSRLPDRHLPPGVRIAAVGAATRRAIESRGPDVDFMPSKFVGEALAEEFPAGTGWVLLVQARQARKVVAQGLAARGLRVHAVEAYQTLPFHPGDTERAEVGTAEAICFTSSSTVTGFLEVYGPESVPEIVVSIGPVTTATAEEAGLVVSATAEVHDVDGLVRAVELAVSRGGAGRGGAE